LFQNHTSSICHENQWYILYGVPALSLLHHIVIGRELVFTVHDILYSTSILLSTYILNFVQLNVNHTKCQFQSFTDVDADLRDVSPAKPNILNLFAVHSHILKKNAVPLANQSLLAMYTLLDVVFIHANTEMFVQEETVVHHVYIILLPLKLNQLFIFHVVYAPVQVQLPLSDAISSLVLFSAL
jgi:hypothetical protein